MELCSPRNSNESIYFSRRAFCRSYRESCRRILENNRRPSVDQVRRLDETSSSMYCSTYDTFNEKNDSCLNYKKRVIDGPLKEFSHDFWSLLINPVFSDVEIKCGDEVIQAHKNILASRSPVFNAMFNTSMVESATGVVTIEELDTEVVRDFLVFIYSNKVRNITLPKAFGLLEASTKYQVETLKDICVDFLRSELTVENALLILQKAYLYDNYLKRHSLEYVSEKFTDIRKTEEWMEVQKQNPVLALEVCNCVIDKMSGNN